MKRGGQDRRTGGTHRLTTRRWLLFLAVLVVGTSTQVRADSEPIQTLRNVMTDRLVIMVHVARHKWNESIPIENLEREAVVLAATTRQAVANAVDRERAETMVRAQIEAAKAIQTALFDQWQAKTLGPFDDAPDLATTLRPEISRLTAALIEAVANAQAELTDCSAIAVLEPAPASLDAFPHAWAIAVAGVAGDKHDCP